MGKAGDQEELGIRNSECGIRNYFCSAYLSRSTKFCRGGFHIRSTGPPNLGVILNTNKIQEKICAKIQYKPVFNSYKIVGLIFFKFKWCFV